MTHGPLFDAAADIKMIDLRNKIIFVHIPKTAGTSIERYFLNIRGLRPEHKSALGIFKNPKTAELEHANNHCSLSMYEQLYFGGDIPPDYRIFTIVRNPYKRFWSEWAYRKMPPQNWFRLSFFLPLPILIRLTEHPISRLKDFNSHVRPQYRFLEGRSTARVRMLRFENLAEEFAALTHDWGLPKVGLPYRNSSKRGRMPTARELKVGNAFIERFYSKDFELLGYPKLDNQ
jgi:hypothetical protein